MCCVEKYTIHALHYSFVDSFDNDGKSNEIIHYMDPTTTTQKAHLKTSQNDYMTLPLLNTIETLHSQMSDTPCYNYEIAVSSTSSDHTEYSTLSEILPDNEEMYEDPGYKEEKIYAWFEKRKFQKFETHAIK